MAREITQRQLRSDSRKIMRALDRGESFVGTRNGVTVAKLVPVRRRRFVPVELALEHFADAPSIDPKQFRADIEAVLNEKGSPRA